MQVLDAPGGGQEVGVGVLRGDAALDGVAARTHGPARQRHRLAGRDAELLAHDVHAVHHLRNRVLDLEPGVHLEEVELALLVEQELDRSRAQVPHGLGRLYRCLAHAQPQIQIHGRRGGFLDQLLMPPLHRALALAEVDRVAEPVGEHLNLHVARPIHEVLHVDGVVAERRFCLRRSLLEPLAHLFGVAGDAHSLAAAPRSGLEQHRVADLVGRRHGRVGVARRFRGARHDRHPGPGHAPPGLGLLAHHADGIGRRPDPREPRLLHRFGEVRLLCEEAVPRVDRVGFGCARRLEQPLHAEV